MNLAFPLASFEITLASAESELLIAIPIDKKYILTFLDSLLAGGVCLVESFAAGQIDEAELADRALASGVVAHIHEQREDQMRA